MVEATGPQPLLTLVWWLSGGHPQRHGWRVAYIYARNGRDGGCPPPPLLICRVDGGVEVNLYTSYSPIYICGEGVEASLHS
jgi:hypothetical protein